MKKNKYGKRYQCFKCGCKFYDLNKPKAICPKCKADQSNSPRREYKPIQTSVPKVTAPPEEESLEEPIPEVEEVVKADEGEFKLDEEDEFPFEIEREEGY